MSGTTNWRTTGVRRGGAAGRWTASPLRTTGCLKKPESTTPRSFYPWAIEICVRTVLPLHTSASVNFVHQTQAGPQTAGAPRSGWGNGVPHGLRRIFGRDSLRERAVRPLAYHLAD